MDSKLENKKKRNTTSDAAFFLKSEYCYLLNLS